MAASSSTDARMGPDCRDLMPVKTKGPEKHKEWWTLQGHEGRVALNEPCPGGTIYVVDKTLLCRRALPPGKWTWTWVDGFGAIEDKSSEDGEALLLEEWMPKQFWLDDSGELWCCDVALKNRDWIFTGRLQKRIAMTCRCACGELPTEVTSDILSLPWPRGGGCRYLWSLSSLYGALKLKQYKGRAGRWIDAGIVGWKEIVTTYRVDGQHIFHGRLSEMANASDADPIEKYLDNPSVTTFGLLSLLCTWASANTQKGGLRKGREACRELFSGIVHSMMLWPTSSIPLRIDNEFRIVWPLESERLIDVRLPTTVDGRIATNALQGEFYGYQEHVATAWVDFLGRCDGFDVAATIDVADLLCETVAVEEVTGLLRMPLTE